jgi:glycosyltransferase involved in cell wall biosynthesis
LTETPPEIRRVSLIVPVYNEASTIEKILARIRDVDLGMPKEIVLIDDGSTDGTRDWLNDHADDADLLVLLHERNRGKGAAVRTGFAKATGDLFVIQDADLEYDPADIPGLITPILEGNADVVFGSRFLGGPHRVLYFWHYVGNKVITLFSDMMTNLNLTDIEVCYKAFRKEVIDSLTLVSDRFGIEVELTAKVARSGARIYEVPISYHGRTYEEGKKITWKDGIAAMWHIVRFGWFSR